MKFHLLLAGTCLLACAFAAPIEQQPVLDEDCVEEMSEPLEIDSENIQMPEIEPAIAAPDEFLMYEDIVEDDADCEEEEAGVDDFEQEMEYDSNAFAYDEGSLIVSNDVDEIVDEAEELVMKPIEEENFAGEIEECEE